MGAARAMARGAPQKVIGRGGRAPQLPKKREVRAAGASCSLLAPAARCSRQLHAPDASSFFHAPSLYHSHSLSADGQKNRQLNVSSVAQKCFKPHVWWSRV